MNRASEIENLRVNRQLMEVVLGVRRKLPIHNYSSSSDVTDFQPRAVFSA